ncbi:MAG: hypothetical protein ACK5P5_01965 [Pseudobdellovibrionaceae bacterium]
MGKFEVKKEQAGAQIKMKLIGIIDEDVDFKEFSIAQASDLLIDLQDLKSINSCGIREWIKWLGENSSGKIQMQNCPKVIVDQINMVEGFLPKNGKVVSFYVPYFNEDSGSEKNVLFRHGTEFTEAGVNPPAEVKDEGGQAMEMDVIESKYFKFITNSKS